MTRRLRHLIRYVQEAWANTMRAWRGRWKSSAFTLGALIVLVVAWKAFDLPWLDDLEGELRTSLVLIGFIVLLFALTFFRNLLIQPFRAQIEVLNSRVRELELLVDQSSHPEVADKVWEQVDPLQLFQASCLEVELKPVNPLPSQGAEVALLKLQRAAKEGRLRCRYLDPMKLFGQASSPNRFVEVSRNNLADYYDRSNIERPSYLAGVTVQPLSDGGEDAQP